MGEDAATNDEPFARLVPALPRRGPLHVGRRQQLWQVAVRRTSDGVRVARGHVRFQVLDQLPAERRR